MRSDDDGFASRQVATSTLLRNTTLNAPVPYRTEIFDVSKFSSVALYLVPTAGSVYPLYVTVEWWIERTMILGTVATDIAHWLVSGDASSRIVNAQFPCRSDYMAITIDSAGAAALNLVVVGQTRDLAGKIVQQVGGLGGAGLGPYALQYNNQIVAPASNGVPFYSKPWWGEIEVQCLTSAAAASGAYVLLRNTAGQGGAVDQIAIPFSAGSGAWDVNGSRWNKMRFAINGQQIQFLAGNAGGVAATFITIVQPVTGHI
jgi:hypothetical protein